MLEGLGATRTPLGAEGTAAVPGLRNGLIFMGNHSSPLLMLKDFLALSRDLFPPKAQLAGVLGRDQAAPSRAVAPVPVPPVSLPFGSGAPALAGRLQFSRAPGKTQESRRRKHPTP